MQQCCYKIGTTLRIVEEGTPWANRAELYIGQIKEAVCKDIKQVNCALGFWDYCVEHKACINNLTSRNIFQFNVSNAHFSVTGEVITGNIEMRVVYTIFLIEDDN